jgi:hypothetical protein
MEAGMLMRNKALFFSLFLVGFSLIGFFLLACTPVNALSSDYDKVCIVNSKDVCKDMLIKWNASVRAENTQYYCSSEGESIGWLQGPYLRNYIYAYKATGDRYWLQRFADEFNGAICRESTKSCAVCKFTNETYDPQFAPEPGWYQVGGYNLPNDTVTRFDFIVGEGLLIYPMAMFIETVYDDPSLQPEFKDDADYYLALAENSLISKWDRRNLFLQSSEKSGVYLFQNHTGHLRVGMSLPHNQMQMLTQTMIIFYRITGNEWYKDRVDKVNQFFIENINDSTGYWEWNYWEPAGPWDYWEQGHTDPNNYWPDDRDTEGELKHWVGPDHKSGYSAIAADTVFESYRNCITYDEDGANEMLAAMKHKAATKSGWYVPISAAWFDNETMIKVRDRLISASSSPNSWAFQTGELPEFYYMMQSDFVFFENSCEGRSCSTADDCFDIKCKQKACIDNKCSYTNADDGQVCSGDCRVCSSGSCAKDDKSLCQQMQICSFGLCAADPNCVSIQQLKERAGWWRSGNYSASQLLSSIKLWKAGCQ